MKTARSLIAAVLAVVSIASHAGTIAIAPSNKGRGQIILTDGSSEFCRQIAARHGGSWNYAETRAVDGGRVGAKGCWHYEGDGTISVRYVDGDDYRYDSSGFTLTDYFNATYGTDTKAKGSDL